MHELRFYYLLLNNIGMYIRIANLLLEWTRSQLAEEALSR